MSKWTGNKLRIETYGTSHSDKIGIVIEGMPRMKINRALLNNMLLRRSGGNGLGTTPRKEADEVEFIHGVKDDEIISSSLEAVIFNKNVRSSDYNELYARPRPSHADYAWYLKEGQLDFSGGGRFSGRLTAVFTVAGALAMSYLNQKGIQIRAYVSSLGGIRGYTYKNKSEIRLSDLPLELSEQQRDKLLKTIEDKDSVGAVVECVTFNFPSGYGNDYFEGLESELSSLLYAIPGVKGVEFGLGFDISSLCGSVANDQLYYSKNGKVETKTNHAGGINGGISNGMSITISVAFRPTPSIFKKQNTIDLQTKTNTEIQIKGRHDSCIAIRAVPVVESAVALALLDVML